MTKWPDVSRHGKRKMATTQTGSKNNFWTERDGDVNFSGLTSHFSTMPRLEKCHVTTWPESTDMETQNGDDTNERRNNFERKEMWRHLNVTAHICTTPDSDIPHGHIFNVADRGCFHFRFVIAAIFCSDDGRRRAISTVGKSTRACLKIWGSHWDYLCYLMPVQDTCSFGLNARPFCFLLTVNGSMMYSRMA